MNSDHQILKQLAMEIMIKKMLKVARLGIAVMQDEGCASAALRSADIIVQNIKIGLDLLLNPLRCKAALRF